MTQSSSGIQKFYCIVAACGLSFLAACLVLWRTIPQPETLPAPDCVQLHLPVPAAQTKVSVRSERPGPARSVEAVQGNVQVTRDFLLAAAGLRPEGPPNRSERAIEQIRVATRRYDKAGLQIVANCLWDNDPEVRAAARSGLMELGDIDAIPILERAETQAQDPDEAERLEYAIWFLQLPSDETLFRQGTDLIGK